MLKGRIAMRRKMRFARRYINLLDIALCRQHYAPSGSMRAPAKELR
jgi:hypothetical protein